MDHVPSSLTVVSSNGDGEEKKVSRPPQEYDGLISGLPLDMRMAPVPIRQYQSYWWAESSLPDFINTQRRFLARDGDVFVTSYPKSGTTWLKALIFPVMTRHCHTLSPAHPLLRQNPTIAAPA